MDGGLHLNQRLRSQFVGCSSHLQSPLLVDQPAGQQTGIACGIPFRPGDIQVQLLTQTAGDAHLLAMHEQIAQGL